jgi:peptidoglycan/LPS O-acetylase OafA/YrhL
MKRNFSLDVLRGVAVLLVLARHVPVEPSAGLMRVLFEWGWTGVDLFFVLSGYLISNLLYGELDHTGTLKVGRFWLRRGLKIWPSYVACFGLMVVIAAAVSLSAGDADGARKRLLSALPNLLFVQNYTGYQWPHSWSLAIEEHFYLALPLLLLSLVGRRVMRRLPAIVLCVCAAVLALRVSMYFAGWVRWQSFYYPTHLRMDALAWGVLLGYLHRYRAGPFDSFARRWPALLAVSLPLLATPVLFPLETSPFAVTVGFTLIYLAYGCLVMVSAAHPESGRTFPPARVAAWLGVYSYTIYLVHSALSLAPIFGPDSEASNVWAVRCIFWASSIVGGVILSHTIERPFLRLRQRLYPSAAARDATPEQCETANASATPAEMTT